MEPVASTSTRHGLPDLPGSGALKPTSKVGAYGSKRPADGDVFAKNVEGGQKGRWPSNLILQHKPDCWKVGSAEVKTKPSGPNAGGTRHGGSLFPVGDRRGGEMQNKYIGQSGTETIDRWECVDDCPVRDLGDQSKGQRCEKPSRTGGPYKNDSFFMPGQPGVSPLRHEDDGGTASRFFKQAQGKKDGS